MCRGTKELTFKLREYCGINISVCILGSRSGKYEYDSELDKQGASNIQTKREFYIWPANHSNYTQ
jgi:hypothetical protein